MTLRRRLLLTVSTVTVGIILMTGHARAQLSVYDPANHAENVLQAARALQQINNQIQSLQNQVLMLENMAKHLQRMDYSSLGTMQTALRQINGMMGRAEGIALFDRQGIGRRHEEKARSWTVRRDRDVGRRVVGIAQGLCRD